MKLTILTIFPEFFEPYLQFGILRRALDEGIIQVELVDIRDYSKDKHRRVDDYPYGGGRGMVMMVQPLADALKDRNNVIHLSPRGEVLTQQLARELLDSDEITLLCTHYEGADQRVLDEFVQREISIGDYILSGGEISALVLMDALLRLVPGVIHDGSLEEESHEAGLLEYHHYTRPEVYEGKRVPEVLLSGHHENIRKYRLEESIRITLERRPDLIEAGLMAGSYSDEVERLIEKIREEKIHES